MFEKEFKWRCFDVEMKLKITWDFLSLQLLLEMRISLITESFWFHSKKEEEDEDFVKWKKFLRFNLMKMDEPEKMSKFLGEPIEGSKVSVANSSVNLKNLTNVIKFMTKQQFKLPK